MVMTTVRTLVSQRDLTPEQVTSHLSAVGARAFLAGRAVAVQRPRPAAATGVAR
jgi:hypothetical protein